jgi:plasmid stability protein
MSVTITLDDNLVAQLQTQADARHLSVEALVLQILSDAVADAEDAEWRACNQRRIELIRQQFAEGLSADEAGELQQLQDMADQRMERLDAQMLDDVKRLYRQAKRMADASSG